MDAETYELAAEIIAERGHHKGSYVNPVTGQAVCMVGAIGLATGAVVTYSRDGSYYMEFRGNFPSRKDTWALEAVSPPDPIVTNDAPETTAEDVIRVLKRAAELARNHKE